MRNAIMNMITKLWPGLAAAHWSLST